MFNIENNISQMKETSHPWKTTSHWQGIKEEDRCLHQGLSYSTQRGMKKGRGLVLAPGPPLLSIDEAPINSIASKEAWRVSQQMECI